jgi:hypothetical protein
MPGAAGEQSCKPSVVQPVAVMSDVSHGRGYIAGLVGHSSWLWYVLLSVCLDLPHPGSTGCHVFSAVVVPAAGLSARMGLTIHL